MSRIARLPFSTKMVFFAPRLRASIPKFPVPAKRSRTTFPSISLWRMLKIDSFTRSEVGRREWFLGVANFRPLDVPLMMRIHTPINPKFEYRNPKQILISNDKKFGTFRFLILKIVSYFGFRASDL